MKAQEKINMETLIPSSLLEEDLSDNGSLSNMKFKDNITLLKDNFYIKGQEEVFHIFII
jgi:hypothetical protein